jgi:hypothetical protein
MWCAAAQANVARIANDLGTISPPSTGDRSRVWLGSAGTEGFEIEIIELHSGQVAHTLKGEAKRADGMAMAVAFAPRSGAVAVGTAMREEDVQLLAAHESGCVLVWSVAAHELLQEASHALRAVPVVPKRLGVPSCVPRYSNYSHSLCASQWSVPCATNKVCSGQCGLLRCAVGSTHSRVQLATDDSQRAV